MGIKGQKATQPYPIARGTPAVVHIHRFREIVVCAKFHCANGCGDIAVARQNNRAYVRSLLLER